MVEALLNLVESHRTSKATPRLSRVSSTIDWIDRSQETPHLLQVICNIVKVLPQSLLHSHPNMLTCGQAELQRQRIPLINSPFCECLAV